MESIKSQNPRSSIKKEFGGIDILYSMDVETGVSGALPLCEDLNMSKNRSYNG